MALSYSTTFPPTGPAPYAIDRDWCIGDSLAVINANAENFDIRINQLTATYVKQINGSIVVGTNTEIAPTGGIGGFTNVPALTGGTNVTSTATNPTTYGISVGLTFTSGIIRALAFSNSVNNYNDAQNYNDVFPPAGKTMNNLVGFIPSIAEIYFAGGVNADDKIRCVYRWHNGSAVVTTLNAANRIRVWVQNSEQRAIPAFNYLAIWN